MVEKFANERKGKKCAIIDYSSVLNARPMAKLGLYASVKTFNYIFSQSLALEYSAPTSPVDLDVLTVLPSSVISQMNSGRYTFSVTADAHAQAVVDALGY